MPRAHANSESALIVGCGYLGRRVAERWYAAGRTVAALTRRNADAFAAAGLVPHVGDVLDPQSLRGLPRATSVLYAVGLDRAAGRTMREVYVRGLANVLDALPPPERFLYVSSTGVYGQSSGEWVAEESAIDPREESGKVVREAEELIRSRVPGAIVLRLAGIYGPDRLLRKRPILAGESFVGDAEKWLNLIHVADGAEAVVLAETKGVAGETYNVADDEPASRRDFYTRLAELLDAPPARFAPSPDGVAPAEANRRISNRKLRGLGWAPQFPSFREGLPRAVSETTEAN